MPMAAGKQHEQYCIEDVLPYASRQEVGTQHSLFDAFPFGIHATIDPRHSFMCNVLSCDV